jgi:hypothetical protein
VLRTLVHTNPSLFMTQARDRIDDPLATAMHTMQTTSLLPLGVLQVLFLLLEIIFLNVPLIADWQAIECTHEHNVNENLQCANRNQCQYDHALG